MTLKQLFDKVATTNEVLKVVEKRFNVMIQFDKYNTQEFESYEELERFLNIEFFDFYKNALLNTKFEWTKPINAFYVECTDFSGKTDKYYTEITLCEHDL